MAAPERETDSLSSSEKIQDDFLRKLKVERAQVAIYLVNGIRLHGWISAFDRFGLLLEGAGSQFIYKQSISTILPHDPAGRVHAPVSTAPVAHPVEEPPKRVERTSEPPDVKPATTRITLKPRKRT